MYMKRISQLIVSLLLINVSCVMGMNQLAVKPEKQMAYDPYKKKNPSKELEMVARASSKTMLSAFSLLPAFGGALLCGDGAQTAVCCNPTMITLFQALSILQITGSFYELWNASQKSPRATSKKSSMILAASFVGSAIPWACASMIDNCPSNVPYCIQGREFFCLLHLLIAGCTFYEANHET